MQYWTRLLSRSLTGRVSRRRNAEGGCLCCQRFLATSEGAATRRKAIQKFGAPPSIQAIPDDSVLLEKDRPGGAGAAGADNAAAAAALPNAFIRSLGCARRVFLLDPHLTAVELQGLAYRLKALTRNEGLSAILISSDSPKYYADGIEHAATDDHGGTHNKNNNKGKPKKHHLQTKYSGHFSERYPLPDFVLDREDREMYAVDALDDDGLPPEPGKTWLVASGYDPLALYKRGEHVQPAAVDAVMDGLQDLARAVKGAAGGGGGGTKIPTLMVPHGQVADGGLAYLYASYVLATQESSFCIRNPSRGLTLDPVGASYLLPRLGREFGQPASRFPGCSLILALTGYCATAEDMMETGLATNYMESYHGMINLEESLVEMSPWNQQALTKNPVRFYNDPVPEHDHHADFRNVAVADLVHSVSAYRADGADLWTHGHEDATMYDPSRDFVNAVPDFGLRESDLVNYAATFHGIFNRENSVAGILERFREISCKVTDNPEEQEGIAVAQDFVRRLEQRSPLALEVTYRLLWLGSADKETMESCMARERKAQSKLMGMTDFENWARHQTKKRRDDHDDYDKVFTEWKHKSLADVTNDEVAELVEK